MLLFGLSKSEWTKLIANISIVEKEIPEKEGDHTQASRVYSPSQCVQERYVPHNKDWIKCMVSTRTLCPDCVKCKNVTCLTTVQERYVSYKRLVSV